MSCPVVIQRVCVCVCMCCMTVYHMSFKKLSNASNAAKTPASSTRVSLAAVVALGGFACRYWRTCDLESVKLCQIKTTAYGHRLKLCVGHILGETRRFEIKTCLILEELTENFINIKHGLMTDVCQVNLDKCVLMLGTSNPVLFVEAQLLLCRSE